MNNYYLSFWQAYRNKLTNKLLGTVHLSVQGKLRGRILLSYLTGPFTLAPGEQFTDPHTNYWECFEIARLFSERGYSVDIIDAKNTLFLPKLSYSAVVDVRQNLERLSSHLPNTCKKVMHITSCDGAFQNTQEQKRLKALKDRRGISLPPTRPEIESNNPAFADFLEGFGNSKVHETYAQYSKPIFSIPISVTAEFDFDDNKNFEKARTEFLFFSGGGAILKGLDLTVEAFSELPEYTLHIIGPAAFEEDFAAEYSQELSLPNIHRYPRPRLDKNGTMFCDNIAFKEIANRCAALIYPSASEGTSGAVVQAMHAGVIPIVTPITGLREDAPAIPLPSQPSVNDIRSAVHAVATSNPNALQSHAHTVWQYARKHYTKDTFSSAYSKFIDEVLHL